MSPPPTEPPMDPELGDGTQAEEQNQAAPNVDKDKDKAVPKSVKSTGGGAKVKMPSAQLTKFTKACNALGALCEATPRDHEALQQAMTKVEDELNVLIKECENVRPVDEAQRKQKQAWMVKNVPVQSEWLKELKEALLHPGIAPPPLITLNGARLNASFDDAHFDGRSNCSRLSATSSVLRAAAEAQAEKEALMLEQQYLERRQQQELEERRLQQLHEQEQLQRRLQHEREEVQLRVDQARVRQQVLQSALSERNPGNASVASRSAPELPRLIQPTRNWLTTAASCASRRGAPSLPPRAQQSVRPPIQPSLDQTLVQHLLLAQAKLPTFRGDSLDFLWFQQAIEEQVEQVTPDAKRRLHLLLQQLEGEPYTLVKGCQLIPNAEIAYARAKAKLVEQYGNPIRQAHAFKARLLAWPSLRKDSAKELRAFSIQLQHCEDVKQAHGLEDLDSPGTLHQLMSKLTERQKQAWRLKAYDIESVHAKEASYSDFVAFVKRLAEAANHPTFGLAVATDDRSPVQPTHPHVRATAADPERAIQTSDATGVLRTSTEAGAAPEARPDAFKAPCLLCNDQHPTARCSESTLPRSTKLECLRGLCFGCLKPGHQARQCKHRLKCSKCQGLHPTILHEEAGDADEQARAISVENQPAAPSTDEESAPGGLRADVPVRATAAMAPSVVVATVPVRVWGAQGTSAVIRAILDNGSSATFVTSALIQQIKVNSGKDDVASLKVSTLTGTQSVDTKLLPGLRLENLDDGAQIALPPVYTVSQLPFSSDETPSRADLERWPHLRDVPLNLTEAPVAMLIGVNVPDATLPVKIVRGGEGAPYAFQTKLGWCVNGPMSRGSASQALVRATRVTVSKQLQALYYREFEDAYSFAENGHSQEDRQWLDHASGSILRIPSVTPMGTTRWQYQLPLPFRSSGQPPLANNRPQALRQMLSLRKKFESNKRFFEDYKSFMEKMQQGGFVEPVPPEEELRGGKVISYVPHHGVYHPRKPGKIRVVFNCASRFGGISLNDCLLSGPDLTSSLVGVLLRFRQGFIPFMADIESMFYQVLVPPDQRDVLRYLWWPDGDYTKPPQTFRLKVHLFGAASSPSCANFALRRAAREAPNISDAARSTIMNNFYVDDCLRSVDSEQEAVKLAKEVVSACTFGGFRLTKFVSPSMTFLRSMPQAELAKELQAIDLRDDKNDPLGSLNERALGVAWSVSTDQFEFRIPEQGEGESTIKPTKRHILSKLSAIYDPLGMSAPVIIQARIFFRRLTKMTEVNWDDPIAPSEAQEWKEWTKQVPMLKNTTLPRCLKIPQNSCASTTWALHIFCDASTEAYAAVAYLRQNSVNSATHAVSFVLGKARVSPPKVVTIPRLELTAAKLATELASTITKELQMPISSRTFWTDSQTVIKYLQNRSKRFHTFVANRLAAILTASEVTEWRYVPSELNPADCASRGLPAAQLPTSMWLQGPAFLTKPKQAWPPVVATSHSDEDLEIKVRATRETLDEDGPLCFVEQLAQRYSSAWRLWRALAYWLRFKRLLSKRGPQHSGPVSVAELRAAEFGAISWLQRSHWAKEIDLIQSLQPVPRASPLHKLSPAWDALAEIIVMRARTRRALPIIPKGRLAQLLVEEAHIRQAHLGRQSTQAEAARRHWIIGLGQYARRATKGCTACQLRRSRPLTTTMAALPNFRLASDAKPFEHTGVDYFGPFYVQRGRATVKAYGVIFTCAVSRAIHLEVAENLSSQSFINALRRFICRRGHVKHLVSDNGTNFSGADAELANELEEEVQKLHNDDSQVRASLRKRSIEWSFNPAGASHHGGFWERLIQSVRRVFEALLREEAQRPLSLEALTTLLCEAEAVLNDRPLTTTSDDPNDFEALMPNHLLLGREGPASPPGNVIDEYSLADRLRRQWKRVQHLATQFWRRWNREYKTLLYRRSKWHQPADRHLEVNDMVLVVDPMSPRDHWPLGRVHAVHRNIEDGCVRVVDVRTSKGIVQKPITKLCLLETASMKP